MLSHSIPGLKPPHPHLSLSLLPSSQFLSAALQSPTDKKPSKWTSEEDELLRTYVSSYNGKQWKKISENISGKTPIQCLHRWSKILKPGLVKGPWTQEEDQKLIEWVKKSGSKKWSQAANAVPGRSGKQCRERWLNNLDPEIKKGDWSLKEDETIFEMYRKYGSSWSKMARKLKGRTENAIKNRFYSALRRVAVSRPGGEEKKDDLMLDEEEDQERMEEEVGLKEKGESEKKEMKEEDENDKRIEEKKEGLDKENNNLNRPALERKQQVTKKRKFDRESVDMSEPIHLSKKPVLGELNNNMPGSLRSIDLLNDIFLLRTNANQRNSPKVANELGSLQTVLRVFINSIKDTIRMASTLSSRYMNEITSVAVQGSSLVNNQEAGTKIRRLLAQLNGLENWQKNAQDEVKKLETTFFEGDDINHNSKD